ncbi:MAG: methyl-accepting chemotaxis protein [Planctomycetota bacterium]
MHRQSVRPTGVERRFDENEIIVSKTDTRGVVTYANRVFLRVSGYTESEILGRPHNLIRHPDMPRCVFKFLWNELQARNEVFAYVVNQARNGDHYWVLAHVTPTFDESGDVVGYHSNRRVPSRSAVKAALRPLRCSCDEERKLGDGREALAAPRPRSSRTNSTPWTPYHDLSSRSGVRRSRRFRAHGSRSCRAPERRRRDRQRLRRTLDHPRGRGPDARESGRPEPRPRHRREGELGELLHGINDLLDVVDAFVRESGASLEHVSRRKFFRKVHEHGFGGSFARSARTINHATEAMRQEHHELAAPDAPARARERLQATSVRRHRRRGLDRAQRHREPARQDADARARSRRSSPPLGPRRRSMTAMAGAAEALSRASRDISEQVRLANGIVDRAVEASSSSSTRVHELSESTRKIESIVSLIDSVADQTTMLALNAAIEAARAGDSGRGFAIVASAIKSLAGETGEATDRIEEQVSGIRGSSETAVHSLRGVTDTLAEVRTISGTIQSSVSRQDAVTDDVRRNTSEAASQVEGLTSGIEAVSEVSARTRMATQDILDASGGLEQLAVQLRVQVDEFLEQVRSQA